MLELGVKFLISYFLGSLMGALVIGKLRGGVDIRTMGSGNAGGTNALRTQGFLFALGVVVIDVGKGAIGAGVVPGLDLPFVGIDPAISRSWLAIACASAAVLGHVWPVYYGFEGGKGAATMVGTLLVLSPKLVLVILLVFAVMVVLTGYVGLSTMTAAASLAVWLAVTRLPEDQPLFFYCTLMALFIIYWHRANIARMRAGNEHRHNRVMIFSKSRSVSTNDRT